MTNCTNCGTKRRTKADIAADYARDQALLRKQQLICCDVKETTEVNDYGYETEGVLVTCSECGHSEFSFGRTERSVKRSLALMRGHHKNGRGRDPFFYSTCDSIKPARSGWR